MHKLLWLLIAVLALAVSVSESASAAPGGAPGPASHIVVFNEGVDAESAAAELVRAHGLSAEHVYRNAIRGASFIIPPGRLDVVRSDPRVAYVEPNQRFYTAELPTGVDRAEADLNATANINGADDRVDVDVAIIDTGIDYGHPDLNVVARTNCAQGTWFSQTCTNNDGTDGDGHGTHVAGAVGAKDNGIGVVGMAPGARLWAVRVLGNDGSGYLSWIIAGVDWVTARASQIEVANMSLGCECTSSALTTAINSSISQGVVYVVAAGNSAKDVSTFLPANIPDVVSVSAIADFDGKGGKLAGTTCRSDAGTDDAFATFSNFGQGVDIAAPGVCILSTWKGGAYATISGTSMASPHVAGGAALYIAANGKPANRAGVLAVRDALVAAATAQSAADGFTGDPDSYAEPLLNVSSGVPEPPSGDGNVAPVANAGPDQAVTADSGGTASVTLDGSGSSDSDGSIASYVWSEGAAQIATGVAPTVGLAVGVHTITLTVTDDAGATATDTLSVTVTSSSPPATPEMFVTEVKYWLDANRKHLNVRITVRDEAGSALSGVAVGIKLYRNGSLYSTGSGTTGSTGQVTFRATNVPSGSYTETLTVTHGSYEWDGVTPPSTPTDPFVK